VAELRGITTHGERKYNGFSNVNDASLFVTW